MEEKGFVWEVRELRKDFSTLAQNVREDVKGLHQKIDQHKEDIYRKIEARDEQGCEFGKLLAKDVRINTGCIKALKARPEKRLNTAVAIFSIFGVLIALAALLAAFF